MPIAVDTRPAWNPAKNLEARCRKPPGLVVSRAEASSLIVGNHRVCVPWSNGNDTSLTKRKRGFDSLRDDSGELNRSSAKRWSAGVLVAFLSCKEGDRVRLSGGPLDRSMGGWSNGMTPGLHPGATPEGFPPGSIPRPVHSFASVVVQRTSRVGSTGSWPKGRAPPWRGGGPGSIPGGSTDGHSEEGSRIRLAGPLC